MTVYARPTTRGELRDKLRDGIACEIVADCAEMTVIMLRGWLEFDAFSVQPSHNAGWTLFLPAPAPRNNQPGLFAGEGEEEP